MPPPFGVGLYRVRKDDRLSITFIASVAAVLDARFRVLYDDGSDDDLIINPATAAGTRTVESADGLNRAKANGWVVGGSATVSAVATKRGQFYAVVSTTDGSAFTVLCRGYVYDGHGLQDGEFTEPGPGGGEGNLFVTAVASDVAPSATTTYTPAATNRLIHVKGYVWYYDASADAASRVLGAVISQPLGALPTGFAGTTKDDVWSSLQLTLTASEEGTLFLTSSIKGGKDGYESRNDNGTLTVASVTTNASPFPLEVDENDPVVIVFSVASGSANDRHSIYVLQEEWLVI